MVTLGGLPRENVPIHRTPVLAIGTAGAVSAAAYLVLAFASHNPHGPGLPLFYGCLAIATAGWIAGFQTLQGRGTSAEILQWIVVAALIFRVIGFFGVPLYEDDYYRYLWDGRIFGLTGNPYGKPPSLWFGDDSLPETFQDILTRVNFPEVATIYGPVCELTFRLSDLISPGSLWPLKLIYLLLDGGTCYLVWRITKSPASLLLCAWCPLVIKEVAFTAHTDTLGAFFLLAAYQLTLVSRKGTGAVAAALAAASRVFTAIFAPLLFPWRSVLAWGIFAATLAAAYAPFMINGSGDAAGLSVFLSSWEFNSFGYAILKMLAGENAARLVSLVLFAGFYVWYWTRGMRMEKADILLAVFLFLSPVVNPWYLVLLAPLVALNPSAWGMTALTTVMLSYLTGRNLGRSGLGAFNHPWWVRPLEIAPVLVAIAYGRIRRRWKPT